MIPFYHNIPCEFIYKTRSCARDHVSDTIIKGTLSKNRKNCLDLVNNETKKQPQANLPHSRLGWTAWPTLNKYLGSPEAGSA